MLQHEFRCIRNTSAPSTETASILICSVLRLNLRILLFKLTIYCYLNVIPVLVFRVYVKLDIFIKCRRIHNSSKITVLHLATFLNSDGFSIKLVGT